MGGNEAAKSSLQKDALSHSCSVDRAAREGNSRRLLTTIALRPPTLSAPCPFLSVVRRVRLFPQAEQFEQLAVFYSVCAEDAVQQGDPMGALETIREAVKCIQKARMQPRARACERVGFPLFFLEGFPHGLLCGADCSVCCGLRALLRVWPPGPRSSRDAQVQSRSGRQREMEIMQQMDKVRTIFSGPHTDTPCISSSRFDEHVPSSLCEPADFFVWFDAPH